MYKKIFTKKLAYELRARGCKLLATEVNIYKPQYDVYIFEETEYFKKCLTELTQNNFPKRFNTDN